MLAPLKKDNKSLLFDKLYKTIDLLAWCSVFFTICILVITILSTLNYVGHTIKYFEGYTTFQYSLLITMVLGSFSLFDKKEKVKSSLTATGFLAIAVGVVYFIYINVF